MQKKSRVMPDSDVTSTDFHELLIGTGHTHDLHHLYSSLRITETRLELALNAAGAGLWTLDLDTYLFWGTDKTKDMFGFPKDEDISFDHFMGRVHPDDIPVIQEAMGKVLQELMPLDIEYRLLCPDETFYWVHSLGALSKPVNGGSSTIIGLSVDITDRKNKELAIARQLHFENLLLDISTNIAKFQFSFDLDAHIEQALARILNFFGGDRSALIRLDFANSKSLITHAYYKDGFEQVSPDIDLPSLFPWSFNLLKEGHWHCFSSLDELPTEADTDRSTYDAMGVKSSLRVPIPAEKNVSYLLIINSLTKTVLWPEETLPRLQIFGEVLTNAISRNKSEEELRNSYAEITALKEKLEIEADYLRAEVRASRSHEEIIGQSEPLAKVLAMVELVASTSSTVLVCGETGTGKELIAQAIHNFSPRRDRLMVKVNCASLPSSLVESELFGRERGAYTGALTRQMGRFEHADGSTLFLDEISELSLELQAKLLRVLQEGEFERLGSPKTIKVDVRIIAATNRNLLEEVKAGRFRNDLYYRLNVFPLHVPPLRERREDIPMLVWEFVREFNDKMGKRIHKVSKKEMATLQSYDWPGNIRELKNVIEYAAIVSIGDELKIRLPETIVTGVAAGLTLEEVECRYIEDILRKTNWRIKGENGAALILGMNPATLYSRMKKLGVSFQREKDGIQPLG